MHISDGHFSFIFSPYSLAGQIFPIAAAIVNEWIDKDSLFLSAVKIFWHVLQSCFVWLWPHVIFCFKDLFTQLPSYEKSLELEKDFFFFLFYYSRYCKFLGCFWSQRTSCSPFLNFIFIYNLLNILSKKKKMYIQQVFLSKWFD